MDGQHFMRAGRQHIPFDYRTDRIRSCANADPLDHNTQLMVDCLRPCPKLPIASTEVRTLPM